MSGFDKIEFTTVKKNRTEAQPEEIQNRTRQRVSASRLDQGGTKTSMPTKRKKQFKFSKKMPAIVAIVLVIFLATSIPAYATYKSGLKTYRQAKLVASALKSQNLQLANDEIKKTQTDLKDTQRNLHFLLPLKIVPIASFYYNDLDHLLNAGAEGLTRADKVTQSLIPYADVLGLKGDGSATGTTEDRIKTAVMTTGKITPQIDEISDSLAKMQKEIDKVDPNHYPEFIFGKKIKAQLTQVKTVTDDAASFTSEAKPLVKLLPSLLGESEKKKYLVLFQNDKELRPTGGFITAYATFTIDKGIIKLENSDDIYKLDDSIPNKGKAAAPILKYFPGVYTANLRDSNLSPDFIDSMHDFRSMYERAGLRQDVDGIIAIDTSVLVSTIKILDDSVTAGGMTFNTKQDPRCDCPQVIYELENNISRPVNYVKTERKGLIGDLISAIMTKALTSSPKIYWGPLFQSMIAQTNQKHIMYYLYDNDAQSGIEGLNAAGRIRPFDGDYLHINEANFSGAKVNIFMQEAVENSYTVDSDGAIEKTVTINYKNPYPPSDCNLERGGLCLNAEYRDWIRIYVPKGSELIDSKGSQVKMSTYDDLGKTVFEGFITVRPKGVGMLTLHYKLPFKLKSGSPLPVLIQKQPGTAGNMYTNVVKGKDQEPFALTSDKELELKVK